ncbi:hypothetical protein JD276_08820 [Leucobacter sp. CSA1]|uniref:Uncharacterized protein n=1 Tax=Leucobacter chromiisoli TaxID=2796471 RepID=A0A934UUS8_9MICO|nr:hypothetical protein [Leucobacter chromiisoli]MBK0419135.1 hypothetical protein [Leucobacter chromiisoli]
MPVVLPVSRSASSPWSRARGVGAAAAALVFFGSVVTAPFSMSTAFADEGRAAVHDSRNAQGLTSADASEPGFDVDVSAVEEVPRAGAGDSGSAGAASEDEPPSDALYTLEQFMFSGVVNWGGYKFTYYSQQVLPGQGLQIPGRHVNAAGYVSDGDGYIVLAGSAPKGTVVDTPFGSRGKIYDRGTFGNHLDVYIR